MFYGSPLPPPSNPQGSPSPLSPGVPPIGMGVPPAGLGASASKPPEELAFQEARAALKAECRDNVPLLMGETKKLGVAVLEAAEVVLIAQRRGVEVKPAELLRQEMQNQVMAYALMRFLPDEAWQAAAESCGSKLLAAAQENPPVGKAGVFVRELEGLVKDTPRNREAIQQWLLTQPLFRVLSQKPESLAKLEEHFLECAPKMNQMIQATNESLTTLLHQQKGQNFRPL